MPAPRIFLTYVHPDGRRETKALIEWALTEHCQRRRLTKDMLTNRVSVLGWTDQMALETPCIPARATLAEKAAIKASGGVTLTPKQLHDIQERKRGRSKQTLTPRQMEEKFRAMCAAWGLDWRDFRR